MSNHAINTIALGRLVKEYKSSRAQRIKIVILALLCGGIALIFFTAAILDTQNGLAGEIGFSVIGALFSLPVIVGVYTLLKSHGVLVSLYENGLVYRRARKEFVTTWDEIASYVGYNLCQLTTTRLGQTLCAYSGSCASGGPFGAADGGLFIY